METLAVILIVGAAGALILRSFVRSLKGRSECGGCKRKCETESNGCDKVE